MANITPSSHFISVVSELIACSHDPIRIAEIGVDRGATTKELTRLLRHGDILDLFDVYDCPAFKDLDLSFAKCEVIKHGNTRRRYDSYAWSIAQMFLDNVKNGLKNKIWDAVYLDGAHVFHVDAPTTCCIKEMIKSGGFIVFDDMFWSLSNSPTCNTLENKEMYTEEQMQSHHIQLIVELFMRTDTRFVEVSSAKDVRSIFVRN